MSTAAADFARVLAEAGEGQPAELPAGERALAELQSAVTDLDARRLARWQRNDRARQLAAEAYERANAAAGVDGRPLDSFPWLVPPRACRIW